MFLQLGSVSIGYDSSVDETSCCYLNLNYELATQQNNNENVPLFHSLKEKVVLMKIRVFFSIGYVVTFLFLMSYRYRIAKSISIVSEQLSIYNDEVLISILAAKFK